MSNFPISRAMLHMSILSPPSWHMYPRIGSHWYLRLHFGACAPARGAVSVAVTARTARLLHPRMADWMKRDGEPNGSRST